MPVYPVYSLRVRCARPLPGARPLPDETGDSCDIEVVLAGAGAMPGEWLALDWHLVREQVGPGWVLRLHTAPATGGVALRLYTHDGHGNTTVLFAPGAARIVVYWDHPHADAERFWPDLAGWILGTVLGYAVCMRGLLNLHGGVVAMDGRAVALLGGTGAGKSTLAAAFVAAGWAVVSDDHVVLSPDGARFSALPGPPRLRLWPESLPVLDLDPERLPRVVDAHAKRYVDLSPGSSDAVQVGSPEAVAGGYCDVPAPLAALYILDGRDGARLATSIEALEPAAALHELLRKRFLSISLSADHTAAQLAGLSALARSVPVRRLQRPDGLDTLPDVVRAIRTDLDGARV